MIKHIVMLKFKDYAKGATGVENAEKLKTMLENLMGKIDELKSMEVGLNVVESSQASDLVLVSVFDDMPSLKIYANHPEHQKVIAFIQEVIEERRVVDFVME